MSSRREFIRNAAWTGASAALGFGGRAFAAEPPPETPRIRIAHITAGTCWAPQYVAEEMLRGEGFSDLRYVKLAGSDQMYPGLAAGEIDMSMSFIAPFIVRADTGGQVMMLAGIHPGCIELYASERVRSVRDLKGEAVSIAARNGAAHAFIVTMVSHVGLDPRRDINWLVQSPAEGRRQLAEGKVAAMIASPPVSYEMRAKKIGHVILNMTTDRPWSQYFCCVLTGNRDFVRKHPVATKRAMRAILKGANLCVSNPEPSARILADRAFATSYDAALQTVREVSYARWRELDTEDTVRFYSLRLHEAGMIKSNPKKILAEATDFRFLNELKKELKS